MKILNKHQRIFIPRAGLCGAQNRNGLHDLLVSPWLLAAAPCPSESQWCGCRNHARCKAASNSHPRQTLQAVLHPSPFHLSHLVAHVMGKPVGRNRVPIARFTGVILLLPCLMGETVGGIGGANDGGRKVGGIVNLHWRQ